MNKTNEENTNSTLNQQMDNALLEIARLIKSGDFEAAEEILVDVTSFIDSSKDYRKIINQLSRNKSALEKKQAKSEKNRQVQEDPDASLSARINGILEINKRRPADVGRDHFKKRRSVTSSSDPKKIKDGE